MKFVRRFLFCAVFIFSITSEARVLPSRKLVLQAGRASLQGQRYLRADGTPNTGQWVIFTHGLGSNYHEFEYLIPEFMAAGYDCFAFNFRGHGSGNERSTVTGYREGDYRFEKMATEDFPAMLEEAQISHGGGKGIIVGHSMGGMTPRAAFALGMVSKDQIEAMILLGSPPHFESVKNERALDLLGFMNIFEGWLYAGPGNLDVEISRNRHRLEFALDLANLFSAPYWAAKLVVQSVMKNEIRRAFGAVALEFSDSWLDRSMSARIPKDILRSFADYTRDGYPYKDAVIPVPILHIMGEKDVLVKHEEIAAHAATQSESAGYWLARVDGVGHLGLVTPKAIEAYRSVIFEFLKTGGNLGSSHKSYFELTPESCVRRLEPRAAAPAHN